MSVPPATPMKRDERLQPLSRDHHEGLVLARALRWAVEGDPRAPRDPVALLRGAWTEVLDLAETPAPGVAAIRLRLVATKGRDESMTLRDDDGSHADGVLLDLDLWALGPA